MITHLLMDADHVLINKPALWSVVYAQRRGIDPEEFESEVLPFFTGPFQDCLIGKADLKEIIAPWLERWPQTGTVDEFLAEWFQAEHFIDSELLEEIKRLRQRGLKVYVATNQEKYRTEYMLHEMGFARQFDGMLASYDLGAKKPDRAFFAVAYDRLCRDESAGNTPGVNPGNHTPGVKEAGSSIRKSHILFFDNDEANVAGARRFGIRTERYENLAQFKRVMNAVILDPESPGATTEIEDQTHTISKRVRDDPEVGL